MFADDDLLPLSALQHLLFCPRQCALIHIEQIWAENRLTVEGQHLHRRSHHGPDERRGDVFTIRGLLLRSLKLGLVGKADVVEFHPPAAGGLTRIAPARLFEHIQSNGGQGWRIVPVEYKRGRPKADSSDRVQLCAQAVCLEEMLGVQIDHGELFYGVTRRRIQVAIEPSLRELVADAARRLHELVASGVTPPPDRQPKCDNCSLVDFCLPATGHRSGAAAFADQAFRHHLAAFGPDSDPFDLPEPPP